jgi:hypothetical protein
MDETQEKSVIESDSKEKIGNTITQLNLLHRLFINHGHSGGHPGHWGIRDDLLVVWKTHRASRQATRRRPEHYTYPPLGLRIVREG